MWLLDARAPGERLAPGALSRRVTTAASEWHRLESERSKPLDVESERSKPLDSPPLVVVCGGRAWGEDGRRVVEADAMACALVRLGVPEEVIVRERASMTTRENGIYTAAVCARRGIRRVALVTCAWHLPRATKLFEACGLEVVRGISAGESSTGWSAWAWRRVKERILMTLPAL